MSTIRAESLVAIGRRTSPPVARSIAVQSGHNDSVRNRSGGSAAR